MFFLNEAGSIVYGNDTLYTNGVPVGWLRAYGYTNEFDLAALSNPDTDPFLNWQEYHADTNPTNAQSHLSFSIAAGQLHYQSSTNCAYAVEWSGNLSSNVWNPLTNHVPGTGGVENLECGGNQRATPLFSRTGTSYAKAAWPFSSRRSPNSLKRHFVSGQLHASASSCSSSCWRVLSSE